MLKRTSVYVDGFNVYFAIRYTPYRWLDVRKLVRIAVGSSNVGRVRYFTARIEARADPNQPARQDIYLRALRTLPGLTIHTGQFLSNQVRMAYVHPPLLGAKTALVWKTEEKGSDVNLATFLVADGFRGEYERAVVITNDSDLVEPIRLVRADLGLEVVVLAPTDRFSTALSSAASVYRPITEGTYRAAQFRTELHDETGDFHRPEGWDKPKTKPVH